MGNELLQINDSKSLLNKIQNKFLSKSGIVFMIILSVV